MAGTREGALKGKAKRIAEIGEEAYKEEQRQRGIKAGINSGKARRARRDAEGKTS